ncbi:MAG TPA: hypothetical protein VNS79_10495 [Sphingobium sp.]|nr:hypothetical protein [Sphingobium sp.]
MKYLFVSLLALSVGTAAVAQGASNSSAASPPAKYPRCSKTVTDECIQAQPASTHHAAAKTMKHHRAHHHIQPAQKTS